MTRKERIEHIHTLMVDIGNAMQNSGIRRVADVADIVELEQFDESELAHLLVETYMLGKQHGKRQVKDELRMFLA